MYKPSTYLFSYLSTHIWDLFPTELFTKVKPNINFVDVHPQLSNNRHPVDVALVAKNMEGFCFLIFIYNT
jgi:hypothetical protein